MKLLLTAIVILDVVNGDEQLKRRSGECRASPHWHREVLCGGGGGRRRRFIIDSPGGHTTSSLWTTLTNHITGETWKPLINGFNKQLWTLRKGD